MGIEAIGFGLMAAGMAYGAHESSKATRHAGRAANQQREYQARQDAQIQSEQAKMNKSMAQQQRKIEAGQARSNRRRIKGGIFGDSDTTPKPTTPTLG
jgi:hypothetical protein